MNFIFYKQQFLNHIHIQKNTSPFWGIWFFVLPITPLLAYAFFGYLKILPSDGDIPKYIYIIVGITSWLLFSDSLTQPTSSIHRFKHYFCRQEIGFIKLMTAWLPERLVAALLQFLFCLMLVVYEVGLDIINISLYLFVVLMGFIFFNAIGAIVAVVSLIFPSLTNFIVTINRFLLFLSAVIFPLPNGEIEGYIKILNPYYVYIDSARKLLFGNEVDWQPIIIWSMVALLFLIILNKKVYGITPELREYLQ